MSNKSQPTGLDVFHWPEFQALAKRLGIDVTDRVPTTSVTIEVPTKGIVRILHEYNGKDTESEESN